MIMKTTTTMRVRIIMFYDNKNPYQLDHYATCYPCKPSLENAKRWHCAQEECNELVRL